ncbi:tyrosine-type recombinase/integrase [Psychromonas antarctica]|uniref:tyrosine-type recombinase/integrase n=1 Tax=Psychromonas antarctica TaxID=67573 RepID=UPI001EE8A45D|nr:tyrosine-type recombinase/integrase [Psychromonas antarctica]MCG6202321.1 site-specific integrase [Psychromonas antarctica]
MATNIGVEGRELYRKNKRANAILKSIELFNKHFNGNSPPLSKSEFDEKWSLVFADLSTICDSNRIFRACFNNIVKHVRSLNWEYEVPTCLVTHKVSPPLRNEEWTQYAWAIDTYHSQWFKSLGNDNKLQSAEQLYQAVLLSFICHSGHCALEVVKAFNLFIKAEENITNIVAGQVFITLDIDSKKYHSNIYIDDEPVTRQHVYLSELTYALLNKWIKIDKSGWAHPSISAQVYKKICPGNLKIKYNLPQSLSAFCKSAIFVTERITKTPLNQALLEVSLGRIKSYSIPKENLARLDHPQVNNLICTKFYSQKQSVQTAGTASTRRKVGATKLFCQKLKQILKISNKSLAKNQLLSLLELDLNLGEFILISWMIFKLKKADKGCCTGSVSDYSSKISRSWLTLTSMDNFFEMDIADIEDLYLEEINLKKTLKSQSSFCERLMDIHLFAVRNQFLPPIEDASLLGLSAQQHIRAGFVDEPLFHALLTHCHQLTDLSEQDRVALQVIFIISYRCGLRLTECRKLLQNNIEPSSTGWIDVRSNRFSKNKTSNSLRKVPLYKLLLPEELELVKCHIQNSRMINSSGSCLLLTFDSNTKQMISSFCISTFVSKTLRELSGCDHFVFHHLRHSCFSRLQMMLELQMVTPCLTNIVPYTQEQSQEIIELICTKNIKNKYEAIATFAGHATPEITFNNYFHFSDLIMGVRCSQLMIPLTSQQAQIIGLGPRRSCQARLQEDKQLLAEHFNRYLISKYKPIELSTNVVAQTGSVTNTKPVSEVLSIALCYLVLDKIQQGYEIDSTAYAHGVKLSTVYQWCTNAEKIRNDFLTLTKKSSRLLSTERHGRLLPGPLKRIAEKAEFAIVARKLSEHFKTNKELLFSLLDYVLHHHCVNQSGISFSSPKKLMWFIECISAVIPKTRWRAITYRIEGRSVHSEWEKAINGLKVKTSVISSDKGRTGKGTVRLEYISTTEDELIEGNGLSKYSSHLLVYWAHMLSIMTYHKNLECLHQ